jgi:TolB-like protein
VTAETRHGAPPSVAVLPFANRSPSVDDEYFADGMTDELINALAKVPGLHVVSRTSCFAFKGRPEDAREIGRRLQVGTVLEGSIRRAGPRLRVATQLINVADGFLLWSESFDREAEDVFAIQDEIARAISSALRGRLLDPRAEARVRRPTEDLEAYQLYLKGRQSWNRRTEQDLQVAMRAFERALARDPRSPWRTRAWPIPGRCSAFYSAVPPGDAYPRAKQAARHALALEPSLAEAYPAFAYSAMYYDWDWVEAEQAFRRAIELHPGYANAHQWYGNFLSVMGRAEEAIATFERALALDPLSALKYAALGWGCYFARRYQRGEEDCRRGVELEPTSGGGRGSGGHRAPLGLRGLQPRAPGLRLRCRREASRCAIGTGAPDHGLGDPSAMEWLQRGHAERDQQMVFLKVDPRLDALRERTDFGRLLERMRF